MEEARCPECGRPIGGNEHTLTAGNNRAQYLEEIAAGQA
jgi:hypothetical protein